MISLKEMLLQEERRLEHILQKTKEQLKDAPQGSLRISDSNKSVQYYRYMLGEKKYIQKSNDKLIYKLAQKSYDEKILNLAEKRLKQIKRLTRDYDDNEIENVLLNEHIEKRKLIHPVEPTWEQQLQSWMSKEHEKKEFQENIPVIMTEKGERVRSKSEKILADYFYRNGILYKYECPLYLKHFGTVHPDFTFLSKKTKKEIYWEHDGRMDDPIYAQNAVRKINAYIGNGIYPGERLILTFETEKTVLDTKIIKEFVNRYL